MMRIFYFILIVLFFSVLSCATPVAPTGGKQETHGPIATSITPDSGTVSFRGDRVTFTFDDYVDRNSFRNSIRFEPNLNIQFDIKWRSKTAIIKFERPLPDSTTIIISIGTELRDTRGNRLSEPMRLAFSTGSQIDTGSLSGRIMDSSTSKGVPDLTVLLYKSPYDLSKPANYSVKTDTTGNFIFTNLSEGYYKPFFLEDINGNRTWDSGRERAYPFFQERIDIIQDSTVYLSKSYYQKNDTTKTILEGIGVLSYDRLRLRFNKSVKFDPDVTITFTELETGNSVYGYFLHTDDTKKILFAKLKNRLSYKFMYRIDSLNILDLQGRLVIPKVNDFRGSDEADTLNLSFISLLSTESVFQDEPFVIQYSDVVNGSEIVDSTQIIINREVDSIQTSYRTKNNLVYIYPKTQWGLTDDILLNIWSPASLKHILVETKIKDRSESGSIEIISTQPDDTVYRLLLFNELNQEVVNTLFHGTASYELPTGIYSLIIFEDKNEDGVWNAGMVSPYTKPEPYILKTGIPVKKKMTSEVNI